MTKRAPEDIGSGRQLFVDDHWIARIDGATRRLQSPIPRESVLRGDRPWDHDSVAFMRTFQDGDRYRAWYRCDAVSAPEVMNPRWSAYTESQDGIHWEKPDLGIIEFEGSRDNNLVWMGPGANMAPFRDDNPDAPDEQRYKAVVRDKDVFAMASPDGVNWKLMQEEPVLTDRPFDSYNVPFWDAQTGRYVIYTRGVDGTGIFKGGVRWIRRAISPDFIHWSELESIETGEVPDEHLYTNSCVAYERAPNTYLMFPSRYVIEHTPDPTWPHGKGVNDIVFMSSRDGLHFDRSFKEAILRPGLDRENWHERGVYMETGILHTSPQEMSMYASDHWRYPTTRIRRYTFRTDGFVAANAGFGGGELVTHPLVFEGGELEVNYSTSAAGSLRIEVQDTDGRPIPGLAMDDCPEMFGDEIEGAIEWNSGATLIDLAGKPVRLRFALKDADLFAFRFRPIGS